jgi:hypothetical protein
MIYGVSESIEFLYIFYIYKVINFKFTRLLQNYKDK